MSENQKAALAILATRKSNPTVYCWVEAGEDEAKKKAEMQRLHPLNEVVTISWRREDPTAIRTM